MVVLKAIGRFFAKIGRWIRDTAWVQPLLIVGGIFAIIFSIPKIIEWGKSLSEESNAAQAFFEAGAINSDGDDDKLSKNSQLDKFLSIMEDDSLSNDEAFNRINDVLNLKGNKQFFLIFVDSSSTCDELYGGLNYLKNNWSNSEFVDDLGSTSFAYRTIYIDAMDEDEETKNLFEDCYTKHGEFFEELSSNLYNTNFAINKELDDQNNYYGSIGESYTGFSAGTTIMFDFAKTDANINIKGLRNLVFLSDITGSGEYGKGQTLFYMWSEKAKFVFGDPDEYIK